MSCSHQEEAGLKSEESDLPKPDLFAGNWWENSEGMHLTVYIPEVDMENTLVTKLKIKKVIFDINDWHKGCYKARIATDGTNSIVTEPVQVGWMWQQPSMIQTLMDGGPDSTCERTLKKYKTYSVDYKKSKDKQSKETFYKFADSFTVNNNFFNPKVGRHMLDLETGLRIAQVPFIEDKQKYVQFCPFTFWKVIIDGNDKTHKDKGGLSNLSSVFGHVLIQGMAIDDDDTEQFFDCLFCVN
jgi:hypothetical protein